LGDRLFARFCKNDPGMAQGSDAGRPFEVSGYRDVAPIGRGASSTVYKGYDPELSRWVAIKVLLTDDPDDPARKRFKREGEITANLGKHPHIVQVLGTGFTETGSPYVVMELFEQGSIGDRLRASGAFTVDETLEIGEKIADAVAAAHRAGVLHRDIKPQNILLSEYGPALGDFGIARTSANLEWSQSLDQLTPMHAAPEILLGGTSTAQSDLYSLGSTLYAMLAGRPPFAGPSGEAPLRYQARVMRDPVPPVPRADVPPSVTDALDRTLAKNPADRFRSATELRDVLRACRRASNDLPSSTIGGLTTDPPADAASAGIGHFLDLGAAASTPSPLPTTPASPASTPPPHDRDNGASAQVVTDDTVTRTPPGARLDPAANRSDPWDPPSAAAAPGSARPSATAPAVVAGAAEAQPVAGDPIASDGVVSDPTAGDPTAGDPTAGALVGDRNDDEGDEGNGELTVQRPITTLSAAAEPETGVKPRRRRQRVFLAVAGVVVILAGGAVAGVLLSEPSSPPTVPVKGVRTITTTDVDRPTGLSLLPSGDGAALEWSDPTAGSSEYLVYEMSTKGPRIVGVTAAGKTSFSLPHVDPSTTRDCFEVLARIGPDTVGAPAQWCPAGESIAGD
jgi:serine/threonine-protein kinase PknK